MRFVFNVRQSRSRALVMRARATSTVAWQRLGGFGDHVLKQRFSPISATVQGISAQFCRRPARVRAGGITQTSRFHSGVSGDLAVAVLVKPEDAASDPSCVYALATWRRIGGLSAETCGSDSSAKSTLPLAGTLCYNSVSVRQITSVSAGRAAPICAFDFRRIHLLSA